MWKTDRGTNYVAFLVNYPTHITIIHHIDEFVKKLVRDFKDFLQFFGQEFIAKNG
jgi:hypothetical protein